MPGSINCKALFIQDRAFLNLMEWMVLVPSFLREWVKKFVNGFLFVSKIVLFKKDSFLYIFPLFAVHAKPEKVPVDQ